VSHGASIARLVQPTKILSRQICSGADHFSARLYFKKVYVFQLLHFLISIDEFRVSVILLRYTFFISSKLYADRLGSVSFPRRQTHPIYMQNLCIPYARSSRLPPTPATRHASFTHQQPEQSALKHPLSPAIPSSPQ
jgi:hypothetical protein